MLKVFCFRGFFTLSLVYQYIISDAKEKSTPRNRSLSFTDETLAKFAYFTEDPAFTPCQGIETETYHVEAETLRRELTLLPAENDAKACVLIESELV